MHRILAVAFAVLLAVSFGIAATSDYPSVEITNGPIRAKIYLPQAHQGFYRGTRFDWSGVIYSLQANGHDYYGPWFNKTDAAVRDFVYRDTDIVAGPCSAITGPVDEFGPVGYDAAKAGGTFIKIGVGALRRDSDDKYDNYHLYEIANGGKWTAQKHRGRLELTQQLNDPESGYGYIYRKDVRLINGKTEMVLAHSLKNVGKRAIQTNVYNHNFLVLDQQAPGPGVTISVPFEIQTSRPPRKELAAVRGRQISYLKTLEGHDVATTPLEGFGNSPNDSQIRIENSVIGAGVVSHCDRPLLRESLWSIRTVVAMEPFISIAIEPGAEFNWTTVYEYYTVPKTPK